MSENRLSAIAALPVLALVQFAFVGPASAHHLYHHSVSRHRAAGMIADTAAPDFHSPPRSFQQQGWYGAGLYNYAPSYPEQGGRRGRASRGAFNDGGFGASSINAGSFNESPSYGNRRGASPEVDGMAASAASAAGIPASLVARVIKRESGGNPRAVSKGNYGLMQIRLGTARAMGYSGSAGGLLDAQTNMTYAVKYLAGAYRAAGGNEDRAVALYARGYHDVAKAEGFSPYQTARRSDRRFASYQRVADAGPMTTDLGFAASPQFGEQNSYAYGDGARMYRVHHHRRHAV